MTDPKKDPVSVQIASLVGDDILKREHIQELWSGYGAIYRVYLGGDGPGQVVVKHVAPPHEINHPRGWNSDTSHQRKLRSYEVEQRWYLDYAPRCSDTCRVPKLIAEDCTDTTWMFLFEDLDAAGFSERRHHATAHEIRACLEWLASFHATFLGVQPTGLWDVGTYWHLATRPDELEAIEDPALKDAAKKIDTRLNDCTYQTFVHGDAKIANFCFPPRQGAVAAVDFQYVGGGCGMKDVAYFLSSCLHSAELEQQAETYLDTYFSALRDALGSRLIEAEKDDLEMEWRSLYPFAWADFYRFLAGWSPQHWKIDTYSERMTLEVLASLNHHVSICSGVDA